MFDWIINIKLLNENLKEVAICKHCKNVLMLTEKVNQLIKGLTLQVIFSHIIFLEYTKQISVLTPATRTRSLNINLYFL